MNNFGKNQVDPISSTAAKYCAVLLVGAPGSGKGTQGRALGASPNYFHCSCGDVFRSIDAGTELGQTFLEYSRAGKLMPDTLTIDLWAAHITGIYNSRKFNPATDCLVLDGIPRNLAQARMLDVFIEIKCVFNLCCSSRQPLIDRIRKRALKENRPDDADEVVINCRLDGYEAVSQLLIQHYPACVVHKLDALRSPHLIFKEILGWIASSESYLELRCGGRAAQPGLEAVWE